MKRFFVQGVFAFGLLALSALPAPAQSELFGRVLDKVACEGDEAQSYALYVPSNYSKEKKWPVIFCFDAMARGRIPVERLQAAAEKYGYLVAGSLTSRNGPWAANAAATQAIVKDVTAHFSVDARRIYTTGVSGGARVATALAISGLSKGVIGCAAGFPAPDAVPAQIPFVYFGTTGTEDSNYSELRRLDDELEERKAVHRIVVFNGGHEWASASLMTEAVEWLELQAMRAGTRPKDEALVEGMLRARVAAVPAEPAVKRWRALKSLAADFSGLAEVGQWAQEAKTLGGSRAVKDQLKAERALDAQEETLFVKLGETAEAGTASEKKALSARLRQKADVAQDTPERQMVRRAIAGFVGRTRETSRGMFEDKDYERAVGFFELAVALRPDQARLRFDLARAYAFTGEKKRALDALADAAVAGFGDAARVESEPAFSRLRDDPAFQKSLAKIRAEATDPTIMLPAMRVSAALANVELRLFYLPNAGGDSIKPLSFLRVETVRPHTPIALAGVVEGMEITAIQGRRVRGMTDADLNDLMSHSVQNELIFSVREPPQTAEREIHVPLRKPAPKN